MTSVAPDAEISRAESPAASGTSQLRTRLRGVALIAVLGLACLLVVKIEYKNPSSNDLFYAYGITVTAVILVIMTISLAFYQDPAVQAQMTKPELDPLTGQIPAQPLVSCIVAVHNEETLVSRCIASMAAQTYQNSEIIVVDDA